MLDELKPYFYDLEIADEQPGVYVLHFVHSKTMYIGSAKRLHRRVSFHFASLKRNAHKNESMQAVYNESDSIYYNVYVVKTREEAYDLEQALIDHYMPSGRLHNKACDARNPGIGRTFNDEQLVRLQTLRTGLKSSEEHAAKISAALKGKPKSPEHQAKIRALRAEQKGKPLPEHLQTALIERNHRKRRKVIVNGIVYEGLRECSRQIGVEQSLVRHRIKSPLLKYAAWSYAT